MSNEKEAENFEINHLINDKIFEGNFVDDGFTIIRNAISPDLIKAIQANVGETLSSLLKIFKINPTKKFDEENFLSEVIYELLKFESLLNILEPVWKNLASEGLISKMLMEDRILDLSTRILGHDLCHTDDPALVLNLPGLSNPDDNYLFKEYHQEVWSGSGVSTCQFWAPFFQCDSLGGIGLIKGSHLWGHIPHRGRKPLWLPEDIVEIKADLNVGDAIVFHTMTVHGSIPIPSTGKPRLALTCSIRNFRMQNYSYEIYKNWKIYSYSEISKIEKRLGNHYHSPFRLLGLDNVKFDKIIT